MQCPECHKFPSLELQEPEIEGLDIEVGDETATVTAEARIVRTCTEDGTELKEASFGLETQLDVPKEHQGEGHELSVEETSSEGTERSQPGRSPRYTKSFFGVKVEAEVSCSCGGWSESVTLEDEVAASGMEEMS